jgi:molybdenum cofactor biosynthesis protein B
MNREHEPEAGGGSSQLSRMKNHYIVRHIAFPNHSSGNKGVRVRRIPTSLYHSRYQPSIQAMHPEHVHQVTITAAVITVSSSRTPETDESGQAARNLLQEAGIEVTYYALVPDRIEHIRTAFVLAMDHANCIILTGGTGLTPDDCTIEAVRPFLEKEMEGFGEIFRWKSFQEIGTAAILTRAMAGVSQGKAIFSLPGSVPAVILGTRELILPEIRHILSHIAPDQR